MKLNEEEEQIELSSGELADVIAAMIQEIEELEEGTRDEKLAELSMFLIMNLDDIVFALRLADVEAVLESPL